MDGLVLGQAFRAQRSSVDWMIRISANADRSPVPYADEHPAPDGAIAAGRRDPAIRNPLRGRVSGDRVLRVRIAVSESVQAEEALEVHAASLPKYGAARCFGTALTKNR